MVMVWLKRGSEFQGRAGKGERRGGGFLETVGRVRARVTAIGLFPPQAFFPPPCCELRC